MTQKSNDDRRSLQRSYMRGFYGMAISSVLLGLVPSCMGETPPEENVGAAEQRILHGGFVVVSGDDADDSGHCQGTACGGIYPIFLNKAVTESATGGSGILAIGVNGSSAQSSLSGWNAVANGGPGAPITIVTNTTDIANVNFSNYAALYIPSSSGNTSGGINSQQIAALNARQPDIAAFVNVQGGSLVALTQAGAPGAWGFLPVPLTTAFTGFTSAAPTQDLINIAPKVTSANLSHCCFHNVFTGPAGYSGLGVLAIKTEAGNYRGEPVILGSSRTILTAENCSDGEDNDGDGDVDDDDPDCWRCGDGTIDPGEQCDDGNVAGGDGCSDTCQIENHPPVAVCLNVTTCNDAGQCSADISNLGSLSYDPDNDPLTITQSPPGPYAVGSQSVSVTVSDGAETAMCTSAVTVNDCELPAISCPSAIVAECTGNGAADVVPGDAQATDNCSATVSGPAAGSYPLGTTAVTYTATDPSGNASSCSSTIQVVDTTPPVVSVSGASSLWPPNHKMRTVNLSDCGITVADACGGTLDLATASAAITCVSSDEPVNALGDGNTAADIVIVDKDTVLLRSERQGMGDGRVYEVHFKVSDSSGNVAYGVCPVGVPHSQNGQPAVDSGDAYTVCMP